MITSRTTRLRRNDLIYPELSYQIMGAAFDVYSRLGHGHKEIYYQKALAQTFKELGLDFTGQLYAPFVFKGEILGKNYFDFLVEGKVVVELKRGNYFSKLHIDQTLNYLKVNDLKLGLLIYFGPKKLHFKRVVNIR